MNTAVDSVPGCVAFWSRTGSTEVLVGATVELAPHLAGPVDIDLLDLFCDGSRQWWLAPSGQARVTKHLKIVLSGHLPEWVTIESLVVGVDESNSAAHFTIGMEASCVNTLEFEAMVWQPFLRGLGDALTPTSGDYVFAHMADAAA